VTGCELKPTDEHLAALDADAHADVIRAEDFDVGDRDELVGHLRDSSRSTIPLLSSARV
jgi:hypothetical protein